MRRRTTNSDVCLFVSFAHTLLASSSRLDMSLAMVKTITDEEADGREQPDQTAGKRKGMCWAVGRPAQRLKRVFIGAAQVGPPGY